MSDLTKGIAGVLFAVLFMYILVFFMTGGSLGIYRVWAPLLREAQREVFMESQSYITGKVTYLTRLRVAYEEVEYGTPRKRALRTQILTEAAEVNADNLPPDLRLFIAGL